MAYTVILEEQARNEIAEAADWIAQCSPQRALLWHFEIEEAAFSLEESPFRCPLAPENELFPEEIRQLIFQPYRILFTVRKTTVHILRVWHSRRDWAQPD